MLRGWAIILGSVLIGSGAINLDVSPVADITFAPTVVANRHHGTICLKAYSMVASCTDADNVDPTADITYSIGKYTNIIQKTTRFFKCSMADNAFIIGIAREGIYQRVVVRYFLLYKPGRRGSGGRGTDYFCRSGGSGWGWFPFPRPDAP